MTGGAAQQECTALTSRRPSHRPASARSFVSVRTATDATATPRGRLMPETPVGRASTGEVDTSYSVRSARRRPQSGNAKGTGFTKLIERTVDNLCVSVGNGAYHDVQSVLAHIRKQYDEVHFEAERKELELTELRKQVKVLEMMEEDQGDVLAAKLSKEELVQKLQGLSEQLQEAASSSKVYRHMISRLKHERDLMKEKVSALQDHADRKRIESDKRKEESRRANAAKIHRMRELEEAEVEISDERNACNHAVDDLEETLQRREKDISRREDFERWRYEVAMEAASEAFQSVAGRYQKIYTIEKLTGNCLQKIIFEQAEQSQATEDGFQKIREVTGLTDVMDIVHKFLNRDVEHEQLLQTVRDTEAKLQSLNEARAARSKLPQARDNELHVDCGVPISITIERFQEEQQLVKAQQDLEEYEDKVRQGIYLVDAIKQWAKRLHSYMTALSSTMAPVEGEADLLPFFRTLSQMVDSLLTSTRTDLQITKLSKLTSQAHAKEKMEQQKLLHDKDFIRANCRVPVANEGPPTSASHHRRHASKGHVAEEEDTSLSLAHERERMKQESLQKVLANSPKVWRRRRRRDSFPPLQDAPEKLDEPVHY